jgi:hypothetical protein
LIYVISNKVYEIRPFFKVFNISMCFIPFKLIKSFTDVFIKQTFKWRHIQRGIEYLIFLHSYVFVLDSALVIMILLASLNSCCNPWIYMAFSGSISVRVLTSCFPCYGNRSTYDNRTTKDSHENQRMLPRVQSVLTTLSPTPSTSSRLIVPNLITVESSSI